MKFVGYVSRADGTVMVEDLVTGKRQEFPNEREAYLNRIRLMEQCIAKAREILSHSMSESREFLLIKIGKALEALEGK